MKQNAKPATAGPTTSSALQQRVGFLLRRLLQIHAAMFAEETAGHDVTPVQFSLLTALNELGEVDQNTLSHAIGLERSSVAEVLPRLEEKGMLSRRRSQDDRRVKLVKLTRKGGQLLLRLAPSVQRSHDRLIEKLSPMQREQLLRQLAQLVAANNDECVVPMRLLR
ncbi:MAG: winged helix-turn-helix transcriptional regulator [Burkholderiaceae bacterium]|nr:winged helix-turn-helix transcriptional regulator [Burkholderiaceae bacterium]